VSLGHECENKGFVRARRMNLDDWAREGWRAECVTSRRVHCLMLARVSDPDIGDRRESVDRRK
jgi:hypothetical protein